MNNRVHAIVAAGYKTTTGQYRHKTPLGLVRLHYVMDGYAEITDGGAVRRLEAGHLYLFRQDKRRQPIQTFGYEHIFLDFHTTSPLAMQQILDIPCDSDPLLDTLRYLIPYFAEWRKERDLINSALEMILCVIDRIHPLPRIQSPIISKALEIVETRYASITSASLAEELNYNESYFIRLFRQETGMPPMQYIRICRITQGLDKIRSGMDIGTASALCGYTSPAAFSAAVQAHFHCTPSAFR